MVYLLLLDGQELVKYRTLLVRQGKFLAVFNDDDLAESRRTVFALECLSQLLVYTIIIFLLIEPMKLIYVQICREMF